MNIQEIFWVIPVLDNLLNIEKFRGLCGVQTEKFVRGYAFLIA
jgi:hypothetical protein